MLDYKLLEALAMVVQEGGFERAARRLHLTQSAISQRVKLLEDRAGAILLTRSSPPAPTPQGRRLIKHYGQVRRLEDDLAEALPGTAPDARPTLRIGVNADSLAFWFMDAMVPFLREEGALMDLAVDDQERTHRLLRDGEVLGCLSARAEPMQGCSAHRLGAMTYSLLATPDFAARHFPEGVTRQAAAAAPAVVFNRADDLHASFYTRLFGQDAPSPPTHYVPSPEQFMAVISAGLACGMTPHIQARGEMTAGRLVTVDQRSVEPVALYWHRWNLDSPLLDRLTGALAEGGARLLDA